MTLNLSREHWQRMIKIVEGLRLGIDQYFAGRVDAAPLLEETCREFRSDAKAGYWISAADLEGMLDALAGARTRRREHEVGQLAEAAPRGGNRRVDGGRTRGGEEARGRGGDPFSRPVSSSPRLPFAFFFFLFFAFRQSLNHQAVARHEPLVVQKRHTDVRRLPGEDVIGETQLNRYVRKRDARDQVRGYEEREHCRQHKVQKIVSVVPGCEAYDHKENDKQQTLDRDAGSDSKAKEIKPNVSREPGNDVQGPNQRQHQRDCSGDRGNLCALLIRGDRAEQRNDESQAEKEDRDEEVAPRLPIHTTSHLTAAR